MNIPRLLSSRGMATAAAVLITLAGLAAAVVSADALRYPDEVDYHAIAVNLIHHGEFSVERGVPTALRPPGYPFLLAGLYLVSEHPVLAKVLNALALGGTAWLLGRLARSGSRTPAGGVGVSLAPLFLLGYPIAIYTAGTLYPQIVAMVLLAGIIALLVDQPGQILSGALAGFLFGLLILIAPSFLLFVILMPLLCGWLDWRAGKIWYVRAPLMLAVCVCLIVPWTIRNYREFHAIIPVSANGGMNLLLGNSPNTTATSGVNVDLSEYLKETQGMTEIQKDQFFQRSAVEYIKTHPGVAAWLYLRKVAGYFHFRNKLFTQSESSNLRDLVMAISYYPLLLLAIGRLAWWRRFPLTPTETILYLLYFGNALLSAIFFTRLRFRIPFDALLIVLAALAVELALVRLSQRKELIKPCG